MATPRHRPLGIPATLALSLLAAAAAHCSSPAPPVPGDVADAAPSDTPAADVPATDACRAVAEDDGALRYTFCPLSNGCALIVYPDQDSMVGFC